MNIRRRHHAVDVDEEPAGGEERANGLRQLAPDAQPVDNHIWIVISPLGLTGGNRRACPSSDTPDDFRLVHVDLNDRVERTRHLAKNVQAQLGLRQIPWETV